MICDENAVDSRQIDKRVASTRVRGLTARSPRKGGVNGVGRRRIKNADNGRVICMELQANQIGCSGGLREMVMSWQTLGNGYRVYNPVVMRFHRPDELSPLDEGGIS